MTLILRKCWFDGSSRNGFKYGEVGERVTAPNWNPEPKCGNGLHGLRDGNGNWSLLRGDDWLIIDADDQIVNIDKNKCKFNTGVILFRGTEEELEKTDYCMQLDLDESSAYSWAKFIGNRDIIAKSKIWSSSAAYSWAVNFGNRDIMISKIDNPQDAFYWAYRIGNQDVMKPKVTEKYYINCWNEVFTANKIES